MSPPSTPAPLDGAKFPQPGRKPAPAGSLTLLAGCADETYPDHVERVYLQLGPLMRTKDFREGVQSYLEKRPPKFTGN